MGLWAYGAMAAAVAAAVAGKNRASCGMDGRKFAAAAKTPAEGLTMTAEMLFPAGVTHPHKLRRGQAAGFRAFHHRLPMTLFFFVR